MLTILKKSPLSILITDTYLKTETKFRYVTIMIKNLKIA